MPKVKLPPRTIAGLQNLKRTHKWSFKHLSRSQFTQALKMTLHAVAAAHHQNHLAKHFEKEAYTEYGGNYQKYRNRLRSKGIDTNRRPLVATGHFRRKVLQKNQAANITGTSKTARLKIKYGRPRGKATHQLEKKARAIFRKMRGRVALINGRKVTIRTLQDVRNALFRNAGYSAEAKRTFQELLAEVSDREAQNLADAAAAALKDYARINDMRKTITIKL